MTTFEEFEQQLREALGHLYDPAYRPPEVLWRVTGHSPPDQVESVQAAIIRAIQALEPASDIPPSARSRRLYDLLAYRYVQELTQEEAAQRLGITPRHLRREQQQAVEILARRLWEQTTSQKPLKSDPPSTPALSPEMTGSEPDRNWHSQVRQELNSLQKNAPGSVADVAAAIQAVTKLIEPLTRNHHVELRIEPVPPDLIASIHPSVLRQLLITAVEKLVQQMVCGQIALKADRVNDRICLTISGDPIGAAQPPESAFIREILALQGGLVDLRLQGCQVSFQVELPAARKVTVLVVDDNADLVHFYRRYLTGTRYQIVHITEGQKLVERVRQIAPDIIVLDVMLPDMDGWELLMQLREDLITRAVPIIVCSVVRREELALALGAAAYLPKPVRRQQLIQALEQLHPQVSTPSPKAQASNEAVD